MASPIILYIIPNCGLEINVHNIQEDSENNSNTIGYSIVNKSELTLLPDVDQDEMFSGMMSPIHATTLPRVIKRGAGIPEDAAFFSFLHPPTNLARSINWKVWEENNVNNLDELTQLEEQKKTSSQSNFWAMPTVALIGAFVYFDNNFNVLAVNVISLRPTKFEIRLSGPFASADLAISNIQRSNRAQPLLIDHFHEAGFVASAWIRPMETFHLESPLKALGQEMKYCHHGGFMFFRDNGSSIMYVIENSGYVDYEGEVSSLADAFQQKQKEIYTYSDLGFTTNFKSADENNKIKHEINRILHSLKKEKTLRNSFDDKKTLLHKALQTNCSSEAIEFFFQAENDNLLHQDSPYGWTPLFYACRFRIEEDLLILKMIDKCPKSVSVRDKYNRTALHIACENKNVSLKILRGLLEAHNGTDSLFQPTTYLRRLPLHISCYSNASESMIKCLLEYDEKSETLSKKTAAGRLPLHMAVEKKLSPCAIQSLLEVNLRDQFDRQISDRSIELALKDDNRKFSSTRRALYQLFDGVLPLHIACLNNSPHATIKVLLDSDYRNNTVYQEIDTSAWNVDLLDEDEKSYSLRLRNKNVQKSLCNETDTYLDEEFGEDNQGTVALHLAVKHSDKDVIDLLLQKEKMSPRMISTVQLKDTQGRCPLHIACESKKANPAVIQQLLDADSSKGTVHISDDKEYKAIHYACDREDANEEILKLLMKAEERYFSLCGGNNVQNRMKMMTQTCDDRNRSPLYLAVQSEAKDEVIETLLQPDQFCLKGFDHRLVSALANKIVKNKRLQDLIIEKMTERCYFNLLLLDVYANACALWFFLQGSEKMLAHSSGHIDPYMLMFCLCVFIFRTTIQIKSLPSQFITNAWNWCQVIYIVLLASSVNLMTKHLDNAEVYLNKNLLIGTCALLIAQFTFFLKATFLPFARFVGGLLTIFNTLVPFFIVSGLLLLAFTYGFRMSGENESSCPTLLECYTWTLQSFFSGTDDTSDLLDVLFGIIAIVVLLNVLIAIVSEAWDTAADKAVNLFWNFRLQFLSEARFLSEIESTIKRKTGNIYFLTAYIDNFNGMKLVDCTHWTKMPYALVNTKKQYDNPHDYFPKDNADKILKAQSLMADLYWASSDSRRKKRMIYVHKLVIMVTILKWLLNFFVYVLLILIGSVSCGWTWPKSFRRQLLAVGLNNEKR